MHCHLQRFWGWIRLALTEIASIGGRLSDIILCMFVNGLLVGCRGVSPFGLKGVA